MSRIRGRSSAALSALAGAATLLVSCSGGGGQLAEQSGSPSGAATPSTTSRTWVTPSSGATSTASAPVPTSGAHAAIPSSKVRSPRSAAAVTKELSEVEPALRGEDRDVVALAKLGRRQQLAYRALSAHPEWVAHVEHDVPEGVRAAVRANVDAGASLSALNGTGAALPTTLPDWQVLAPQPAAALRDYYDEAEAATGIPWAYLAAIHLVETRMGRIHGPSGAGAQGPMQFIPATWESYGEGDIRDDHDAIQAAGRYLASRGGPTDMARALYSYNNDDRYVAAIEAYAQVMLADPRAYDGYHAWQVFYATRDATYLLPEGFGTS